MTIEEIKAEICKKVSESTGDKITIEEEANLYSVALLYKVYRNGNKTGAIIPYDFLWDICYSDNKGLLTIDELSSAISYELKI